MSYNLNKFKIRNEPIRNKRNYNVIFLNISELLNTDLNLFNKRLGSKGKTLFYSNLRMLLNSGMDILSAFEVMKSLLNRKAAEMSLLENLIDKLKAGYDLSYALETSNYFSLYETVSIRVGEESGTLIPVLTELESFHNNQIKQRRILVSSLTYPFIVIFTSFCTIFFLVKFIVPMFQNIFKRFNSDLPTLTKLVINFSNIFNNYILYVLMIIMVMVIFLFLFRKNPKLVYYKYKLLYSSPIYGKILKKIFISRICYSISLLIRSGNSILDSLKLVKKMIDYSEYKNVFEIIEEKITMGIPLYKAMESTHFFDKKFLSLVKIGEETNQVDNIFDKISKNYIEEIEYKTQLFGTYLEPILILFLGLFVGIILIAMYIPLFNLSSIIK